VSQHLSNLARQTHTRTLTLTHAHPRTRRSARSVRKVVRQGLLPRRKRSVRTRPRQPKSRRRRENECSDTTKLEQRTINVESFARFQVPVPSFGGFRSGRLEPDRCKVRFAMHTVGQLRALASLYFCAGNKVDTTPRVQCCVPRGQMHLLFCTKSLIPSFPKFQKLGLLEKCERHAKLGSHGFVGC
jgi:hypothetical protein